MLLYMLDRDMDTVHHVPLVHNRRVAVDRATEMALVDARSGYGGCVLCYQRYTYDGELADVWQQSSRYRPSRFPGSGVVFLALGGRILVSAPRIRHLFEPGRWRKPGCGKAVGF